MSLGQIFSNVAKIKLSGQFFPKLFHIPKAISMRQSPLKPKFLSKSPVQRPLRMKPEGRESTMPPHDLKDLWERVIFFQILDN